MELDEAKANELVSEAVAKDLEGVEREDKRLSVSREAIAWYERAAQSGDATAMYLLAKHYERGRGVTTDMTKAGFWYKRAADSGHEAAAHCLDCLIVHSLDDNTHK